MIDVRPSDPLRRRFKPPAGTSSRTAPSAPARLLKGIVLLLCCAVVVLPFLSVVSTSLAGPNQVNAAGGFVLWPEHPTLDTYQALLAGGVVTRALVVSILITTIGTLLSLACTTLLAYSLSRPGTFGHKKILLAVLFTLFFAPGMIPTFLMVKELGLLNTYASLILPVLINAFNVVVIRAFFLELPSELIDSARMDGAGDVRILTHVVLPLSKAALSVIGLFYAVAYWNSFFSALLYLNDQSKWPLQLVLRTYVVNNVALDTAGQATTGAPIVQPPIQSLQMAILVLALVPILLVYPFLQRHFIKGVLTGAIKG